MHRMAASATTLKDLKNKACELPKRKTALVIANVESANRHDGDKGILTVEEFLHRLRIPDLDATCLGYSKE